MIRKYKRGLTIDARKVTFIKAKSLVYIFRTHSQNYIQIIFNNTYSLGHMKSEKESRH